MDVDTNQPLGTPTWIDLGVPDLDRALAFYGAVFGWDFDVGPTEYGRYTTCLLRGRRVAAMSAQSAPAVSASGASISPPTTAMPLPNGRGRPVEPC